MPDTERNDTLREALVVYYSKRARAAIEELLLEQGLAPRPIWGRAADAVDRMRNQPAALVIVDSNSRDISVTQALRQVGRMLPESLVFAVDYESPRASVYRSGRWIGDVETGGIAQFGGRPSASQTNEEKNGSG